MKRNLALAALTVFELTTSGAVAVELRPPRTNYCLEQVCLGDGAERIVDFDWKPVAEAPLSAAHLRKLANGGPVCTVPPVVELVRSLPDGRRQSVLMWFRPGESPAYVLIVEVKYRGPLADAQRENVFMQARRRWPGLTEMQEKTSLAGEKRPLWRSTLRDPIVGVTFELDPLDFEKPRERIDGVVARLIYSGGSLEREQLAKELGAQPECARNAPILK